MDDNGFGMGQTNGGVPNGAQPLGVDEEAKAEEAFVNDAEDKVFNPFVEEEPVVEDEQILTDADMAIPGAVGSEKLETIIPNASVNNEATFGMEASTVRMQDLQSDIEAGPIMGEANFTSTAESIEVKVGEKMQSDGNGGAMNDELSAQMDNLLTDDAPVVENTTFDAGKAAPVVGNTTFGGNTTPAGQFVNNDMVDSAAPVAESAATANTETVPTAANVPVGNALSDMNGGAANGQVTSAATGSVATEQMATTPQGVAQPAQPVKKKKTGLIVGVVILLFLLIGGGIGAVLFINWHESKDVMTAEAMSKLFKVKLDNGKLVSTGESLGVQKVSGYMAVRSTDTAEYDKDDPSTKEPISYMVTLNGEMANKNLALDAEFSMSFNDDSVVKTNAAATYLEGGKLYLKTGGLNEILNATLNGYAVDDDEAGAAGEFGEKVFNAIDAKIKDQWIEVSNDAIKNLIGDNIPYNDEYSCITNGIEKMTGESKEKLVEAYEKNSFIAFGDEVKNLEGAKQGLVYYEALIDKDKLKNFAKEYGSSSDSNELTKCFESLSEDVAEANATSIRKTSSENDSKKAKFFDNVYFGIKPWSHEVTNVIMKSNDEKADAEFDLGYDAVTVAAPSDAKSIDVFAKEVFEAYKDVVRDNKEGYIASSCEVYRSMALEYRSFASYYNSCVADATEKYESLIEMEFDEFVTGLFYAAGEGFATTDVEGDEYVSCGSNDCLLWEPLTEE